MNIGQVISNKRKELKLTTIELANRLGVSHTTVIRWESGYIASVKTPMAKKIAEVLHLSPTELLDCPTDDENNILTSFRSLSTANKNVVTNLIKNLLDSQKS